MLYKRYPDQVRYLANIDVLGICGIYPMSDCPRERNPSSVAALPVSSFPQRLLSFLLTQVEGLSTDGVTTVEIVKPSKAKNACDFELCINLI